MRKMYLFLLALPSFALQGQNIHTAAIQWNAIATADLSAGEVRTENSTVVSRPGHIEWKAADGTVLCSFHISKTEGKWTDIGRSGQAAFEGGQATAQFTRGATTTIHFTLYTAEAPKMFELTIANTQPL
jgi:hypothetical protein